MDSNISNLIRLASGRLPHKPRLAPWVMAVDLGDSRLQLRSSDFAYTLTHPFLIDVFRSVESLLDGTHTIDEIAGSGGPDILPTTVIFLLKMLRSGGVLQEGDVPEPSGVLDSHAAARQAQFFSHFTANPHSVMSALAKVRVALIGSGELNSAVRSTIESLGVGDLSNLEVSASGNGYGLLPDDVDLLVVSSETLNFALFDRVNEACLRSGTRWLRVAMQGTTALLGPTFVPRQTACYTCYETRMRSNMLDVGSYDTYRRTVLHAERQPDEGSITPLRSVLAGQVAMEVARLLTAYAPPATLGRFYELGAVSPAVIGHDVLRVPRCSTCGSHQPVREIWDTRPTEPILAAGSSKL